MPTNSKVLDRASDIRPLGTLAVNYLVPNPPKARLPGKGASQPAVGECGRPFEPGRVRDDLVLGHDGRSQVLSNGT
jgi:hypothetical protein